MSVRGSLKTILSAGVVPHLAREPGSRRRIERLTLEEAGLEGVVRRAAGPPPVTTGSRGWEQLLPGR